MSCYREKPLLMAELLCALPLLLVPPLYRGALLPWSAWGQAVSCERECEGTECERVRKDELELCGV